MSAGDSEISVDERDLEAFNRRMEKVGDSEEEFEARCSDIVDDYQDFSEVFQGCLDMAMSKVANAREAARRSRMGRIGRFFEDVGNMFLRFAKRKPSPRADSIREALEGLFSTPEQYGKAVDNTNFAHILWRIMSDTSPDRLDVRADETQDEAVRRVIDEHLRSYRDASMSEDGALIFGEYDTDFRVPISEEGSVVSEEAPEAEDPLLEYARRARLKSILSKDSMSPQDKRIVDDALHGRDVIIIDD